VSGPEQGRVPPPAAGRPDGLGPDLEDYRRRRRTATVAPVVVVAVVASFGLDAVRVLSQGGDTRFGIIPYFLCVGSAVVGGVLVVPLWRRAREARRIAMPEPPAAEPEPRPHLGLDGSAAPPRRW